MSARAYRGHLREGRGSGRDRRRHRYRRRGPLRAWLYTQDGRLVAGATPAADADGAIHRALTTSDSAGRRFDRDGSLRAKRIRSGSGTNYVVLWEGPGVLRWYAQASLPLFGSRVAALLLASGIVCWWLTWQITKPIGTLRAAARRFADGDLTVRVGLNRELRRGDELTDLASEFDRMAARIQELTTSQQQLLADISHEVRSPLARLSLALDLARRRLGDGYGARAQAREVERIDGLIGQLLTLRSACRARQAQLESINLRGLVREVAQNSRFEADGSGRTVTLDGEVDAGRSWRSRTGAKRDRKRRAQRHSLRPRGHGRVDRDGGGHRRAWAAYRHRHSRSSGPGVSPAMLARLFDPFFRVDDARTPTSGGAGLGLAITRQAMVTHGGSATVENAPGGGLIARLELPEERH